MIELQSFVHMARSDRPIALRDNDTGVPTLQIAHYGFKEYILAALSYIPYLKDADAVQEYVAQTKIDNAQTLGVFLHALSQTFGDKAAEGALIRNNIDLCGGTPLKGRVITQLIHDATDLQSAQLNAEASKICGFANLGSTCYANSALKLLMNSMGDDRLISHLENFKQTISAKDGLDEASRRNKLDAAEKFIAVIRASFVKKEPLKEELHAFFSSLQKLEAFNQIHDGHLAFEIIGEQNDAQEFLLMLAKSFDISDMSGYCAALKKTLVNGADQRPPQGSMGYCHDVTVSDPNATLQGIVNSMQAPESVEVKWNSEDKHNTKVTREKHWSVPDLSNFHRFNLHINAVNYDTQSGELHRVTLENANFTDDITLDILDERTNQKWTVTLEPKEIIIQTGTAESGHYFMYAKQGEADWVRHDDKSVHHCTGLGYGDQAKLISFAVKDKQPWSASVADHHVPAITS